MTPFKSPQSYMDQLDSKATGALIAAATDVALIIDESGIIRDIAFGSDGQFIEDHQRWLGKPWVDTVTVESRPKIKALLQHADPDAPARWRQVNHPVEDGPDIPVLYSTVSIGERGERLALGRDLRTLSALQQRLLDVQQSMERDYAHLRHAETRYRMLFQLSTEAILFVDAADGKILEANPTAGQLLGASLKQLVGKRFTRHFDQASSAAIEQLLAEVRAAGEAEELKVQASNDAELMLSASLMRHDNSAIYLVRLHRAGQRVEGDLIPRGKTQLLEVMEQSPDAFVVTDTDGRILTANRAFLDMCQLGSLQQVQDQPLDRWLGQPGVDLNVLRKNLRQGGTVRLFTTVLRSEYGSISDVDLSAVSVPGDNPCLGFVIRRIMRRAKPVMSMENSLPHSMEQLTELVGRVSLKELVRETTDVIERLCIETALDLTDDNRASAAEMLGLSRQSLYVKLRRYGLGDLNNGDSEPN